MNAFWLALFSNALLSRSITVHPQHRDIATKTKIEVKSLNIPCGLNDIIRISAPIVTDQSLYYISKPNGDVLPLNITAPVTLEPKSNDYGYVEMLYKKSQKPIVTVDFNYDVFSVARDEDALGRKEAKLNDNEFLLGPLGVEDHGNWVLSVYNMDYNGDWIELFQVIHIKIVEYVHVYPIRPKLYDGDTLSLGLAYPIEALTSCQLIAPESSFDKMFERSHLDMNQCDFILRNVTVRDSGLWRIVAVGRIVYEGGTKIIVLPFSKR